MLTQEVINKLLNHQENKKFKKSQQDYRTYQNVLHKDLVQELQALLSEV